MDTSDDDDAFGVSGGYASRPRCQRSLSQVAESGLHDLLNATTTTTISTSVPRRRRSGEERARRGSSSSNGSAHGHGGGCGGGTGGERRRSLIAEMLVWGKNWCETLLFTLCIFILGLLYVNYCCFSIHILHTHTHTPVIHSYLSHTGSEQWYNNEMYRIH